MGDGRWTRKFGALLKSKCKPPHVDQTRQYAMIGYTRMDRGIAFAGEAGQAGMRIERNGDDAIRMEIRMRLARTWKAPTVDALLDDDMSMRIALPRFLEVPLWVPRARCYGVAIRISSRNLVEAEYCMQQQQQLKGATSLTLLVAEVARYDGTANLVPLVGKASLILRVLVKVRQKSMVETKDVDGWMDG